MRNLQEFSLAEFGIGEAAESYILNLKAANASPRTVEWYEMLFNIFTSWCRTKNIPTINAVDADTCRRYFLYLEHNKWNPRTRKPGLSQRSRSSHYKGLQALFNFLVREEWIERSPLDKVKPIPVPKDQVLPLEDDELERLLSKETFPQKDFFSIRDYTAVWLFLDTGIRRQELLDLKVEDINIDARTLRIRNGKGGKERHVTFGLQTRKVLIKYLARLARVKKYTDNLFVSQLGTPLQGRVLSRAIERAGEKAKITRFNLSPHKLRHTFAVTYLCNGGDVFSLKALLGHESVQMTMKYVHFSQSRLSRHAQQFSPGDSFMRKGQR